MIPTVQKHVGLPRSGVFEACGDTLLDRILTVGFVRLFTADPEAPALFRLRLVVELRQEQGPERFERIRSHREILGQVLVTSPERRFEVIRVSADLGRATLAQDILRPLPRGRPRPDVDVAGLESVRLLDPYEELLMAVGPHAHVAARQQLQLVVELPKVGGCLLRTAQLLTRLLRLADDHPLYGLVRRLLVAAKDDDIDRPRSLALCSRPVACAYDRTVEAVGLDELPERLLNQPVLGGRPDRSACEDVNQHFSAVVRLGAVVLGELNFWLFVHAFGAPCPFPIDAMAARPLSVRRYFCIGLLGLSGTVISSNPSPRRRLSRCSKLRVRPA